MALAIRDEHLAAVTIPAGKIVEVLGPAPDGRFVVALADDKQ